MDKVFNVTGLCIPSMHYMVDISERVKEIAGMVERGHYFTINRPRQYGKTTILNELANVLREKYIVIKTSFEGTGDSLFGSEAGFCKEIFAIFADSVQIKDEDSFRLLMKHYDTKPGSYNELSRTITRFIQESGKEVVLLIDEVDKSSNSKIFLQFLGLLRNKYLARNTGEDITFKSVILAGVHDIKNLKLAIRDESDTRFNSPWNIAVDFDVDMSFAADEIGVMLGEYGRNRCLDFDAKEISEEIYKLTNGYPYLVSRICFLIDEKLDQDWSLNGVSKAALRILNEKSTLFDDVIKNIVNNEDLKGTVIDILFEGRSVSYNPDIYEKGILYGIFINKNGRLVIHNKLFETRLYNFLLDQQKTKALSNPITDVSQSQFIQNGRLDMEKLILKFQDFMHQEYRKEDGKFYEKHGRLLFLAYLRSIINGSGYYFVETQTRENKRMDIAVTYGGEKHIIELKIWYGQEYEQNGLVQLADYLGAQGMEQGWLITFGLNKIQDRPAKWVTVDGKRIFKVVV